MKNKANKSEIITFRVTDQQKQELELKAAELSIGMSSYLSLMITDYENQKNNSQQVNAKSIEIATQKQLLEKALMTAKEDSRTVANPIFVELFDKISGKELNGKLIRSKYDLLGVLASGAKLTLSEEKAEVQTSIKVREPDQEESTQKIPVWMMVLVSTFVCVLLVVILYRFSPRKASRA